jgi:hypothetical protein
MMYAQYLRIESQADGVSCTVREFIRASHSKLSAKGRSRGSRDWRHSWIRAGLRYRLQARENYCDVVAGRLS